MANKKKRRLRKDRIAGAVLVLAAFVAGIVLIVNGCRRESSRVDVTDQMLEMAGSAPAASVKSSSADFHVPANAVDPDLDDDSLELEAELEEAPGSVSGGRNGRLRIISHGPLYKLFNDSNHLQLAHAQRLGIHPVETLEDAYYTRRPIVHVTTNANYTVDSLTHSVPFLVPEAERLLSDIGRNFKDSLKARGAGGYKIIATSLLRTPRHVSKLRRVNVNATEASTHQFATTFDISYRRFDCVDSTYWVHEEDLKNLLGEVLYDLRRQGRCLVKFERKTACYHVTVAK